MPPTCPGCHSTKVFRSQRRNRTERLVSLLRVFPWRCEACRKRFFAFARRAPNTLPMDRRHNERSRWARLPAPTRVQLVGYGLGFLATFILLGWLAWGWQP